MAIDIFNITTKYDTTFSSSDSINSMISNIGCIGFLNRLPGGFTAQVIVKNDGTVAKQEIIWDPGTDPKFESYIKFNAEALLNEMVRVMLGNGDHNGTVTIKVDK